MCGIAGFIDFSLRLGVENLRSMTDTLTHRGPDASGYEVLRSDHAVIGLGHRRLSIIDLSDLGRQPMTKHGLIITYNGEIYNYEEIRENLVAKGYRFRSRSDTEVILSAFDCWGVDSIHKFIGMFAFVLYDKAGGKVYVFRDRAGVKPLYIYWKENLLLFSSELKAFHKIAGFDKDLDLDALGLYFQFGYVPTPHCIFKNCSKLRQGHYLEVLIEKRQLSYKKYWDVFDYAIDGDSRYGEEDYSQKTEELLVSACNYRMVSDVPVGVFLSGGYDSSLVTALIQRHHQSSVRTYTIAFEEDDFNESKHAREIASYLGTNHQEMTCSIEEGKKIIPIIPEISDEPFGDSSLIPTFLVSRLARKEVTVAISSDGGDEQFVGYNRYQKALLLSKLIRFSPSHFNKIISVCGTRVSPSNRIHRKIWDTLYDSRISNVAVIQRQNLFRNEVMNLLLDDDLKYQIGLNTSSNELNGLFAGDYQFYMQDDVLVKVDRSTMATSLEGREPLLDHRLAEWIMQVPVDVKYKGQVLKYLLKKITHKYIPKELIERPKKGFSVPVVSWLHGDLNELLLNYLDGNRIDRQGIFNNVFIKEQQARFSNYNPVSSVFIWHMLVFQIWYDRWMAN